MVAIVKLALRRPYTFVVMALLIMIFGVASAIRTPTDIFPNINIPVISVVFSYTGLPPDDMAGCIVTFYERSLTTTVNDIEHIESQSIPNYGIIKIFCQPTVNINAALAEVSAMSQTVLKQMPAGITPLLILSDGHRPLSGKARGTAKSRGQNRRRLRHGCPCIAHRRARRAHQRVQPGLDTRHPKTGDVRRAGPGNLIDHRGRQEGRYQTGGGAGGLEVAPGVKVIDSPDFPEWIKPGSKATSNALEQLRNEQELEWTILAPSAVLESGQRTGKFRLSGDQLLVDAKGESRITVEDYAVAMLDELEQPKYVRPRFTVGY
jgi:AcrB/AcrD/AcrF family